MGGLGNRAARLGRWRRSRFGLLAAAAFLIALAIGAIGSHGGGVSRDDVGRRATVSAPGLTADRPGEAALQALLGERMHPSIAGEMTMLGVALDSSGVERVVETGSPRVGAAIRTDRFLVAAGSDRWLRVWRASDGGLLGEVRTERPLATFADSDATSLLVAGDRAGRLQLVDLTDPLHPRLRPLAAALSPGETLLSLAFSDEATEAVAIGVHGQIGRVDTTTGRLLSRGSVRAMSGSLPWDRRGPAPTFTAARFDREGQTEADEGLLLATRAGAVALVDLADRHGRTVLAAGIAPGGVTSIDFRSYGSPDLVVGAEGGLVVHEEATSDPFVERGSRVSGVAFDYDDGFWLANVEGVQRRSGAYLSTRALPPGGRAASRLDYGGDGLVAIHPHGAVSLVGRDGGLALPDTEMATPVAVFDPEGRLLVADGYDANHIEKLELVRPGRRLDSDGEPVDDPVVRTYRPDSSWWPHAEDDEALYVNDVAGDGELVAAGGQDPTGTAAVLVWDEASGRPLRRLPLGTGGVETGTPSIVADVLLLPGKHLLAAYSVVQELVAIWSTDTWKLEATVPTGPIGSLALSPDESTLVAAGISEEEAEMELEDEATMGEPGGRLSFIDVDAGKVERQVRTRAMHRVAWSPDGRRLAALDGEGRLRILTSDGSDDARPPIRLEGVGKALAWRPDGMEIAVVVESGGIVIVDPESGAVTPHFPFDEYESIPTLSWSPMGDMLAATTASYDEAGEDVDPDRARIWGVGAARLQRRMCELAGGPADAGQWRRLADPGLPRRPLCRAAAERGRAAAEAPEDASALGPPVLAFERNDRLFAADADGRTARIGRLERYPYPPAAFVWTGGALAWTSPGQVHLLRRDARRAESWPCACAGLAADGDALLSLTRDGRELVRFRPGRERPEVIRLAASPGFSPSLIGVLGRSAVVAAFDEEQTRATPSNLFLVSRRGRLRRLPQRLGGAVYGRVVAAPAKDAVAFVVGISGGACDSTSKIGVLRRADGDEPGLSFPAMPGGSEPQIVRSVQVAADGSVSASIAPVGCDEDGLPETAPDAARYELRGGRWRPSGERAWDLQRAATGLAVLHGESGSSDPDELALHPPTGKAEPVPVASDVVAMAGRP